MLEEKFFHLIISIVVVSFAIIILIDISNKIGTKINESIFLDIYKIRQE